MRTIFNFQFSIFKIIVFFIFCVFSSGFSTSVFADAAADNGIAFLKSKQDATGKITTGGFSPPSQWAAMAFSANNIDISTVKNPSVSLKKLFTY